MKKIIQSFHAYIENYKKRNIIEQKNAIRCSNGLGAKRIAEILVNM
jgi:hypothetical protein